MIVTYWDIQSKPDVSSLKLPIALGYNFDRPAVNVIQQNGKYDSQNAIHQFTGLPFAPEAWCGRPHNAKAISSLGQTVSHKSAKRRLISVISFSHGQNSFGSVTVAISPLRPGALLVIN